MGKIADYTVFTTCSFNAAFTRTGNMGNARMRTPVKRNTALAIAGAIGATPLCPAPETGPGAPSTR